MSTRDYPAERIARYVNALNEADTYAQLSTRADRERFARAVMAVADAETDPVYKSGYDTGRSHAGADRARVLLEAADAINALPQDWECDPGRGDAAELLRVMVGATEEKSSPAGAGATPDFFQPGHTYSTTMFGGPLTVDYVGAHPASGERYAHGWVHYEDNDSWAPNVVSGGLFEHFTDITERGEDR